MDQYIDAFRKYAVFSGRATRQEFWMFILFYVLVYTILNFVLSTIKLDFLVTIYVLATIVPLLAIGARRLHDTGRTGWWLLLYLIPFLGFIVIMAFSVLDSQTGTNVYGPNPKGETYVAQSAKGWVALVIGLGVIFVTLIILFVVAFSAVLGRLL